MIAGMDIQFSDAVIDQACENVRQVLKSGRLVYDKFVPQFEEYLRGVSGKKAAACFSSDTAAQGCLYRALNLGEDGDGMIIFQGNAFPTPTFEAQRAGLHPIWIDIDPLTLDPSLPQIQQFVNTMDVRAVSIMSTGGRIPSNAKEIVDFCRSREVPVIDDAAHSFKSCRDDLIAGGWADYGIYSFYATKPMTTAEGGAIVSDNTDVVDRAAQWARYGKKTFFGPTACEVPGFSCRFNELQAAVGCAIAVGAEACYRRRGEIAAKYIAAFSKIGAERFRLYDYSGSNFYKFPVLMATEAQKAAFASHLAGRGIKLSPGVYDLPAYNQNGFGGEFARVELPGTVQFCKLHVCIPIYESLTDEQVAHVIQAVLDFF